MSLRTCNAHRRWCKCDPECDYHIPVAFFGPKCVQVVKSPSHGNLACDLPHPPPSTFTITATSASVSVAIPVDAVNGAESNVPSTSTVLGKVMSGTAAARAYTTNSSSTTLKPFTATAALPSVTGNVTVSAQPGTQSAVPVAVAVPVAMSTVQPSLTLRYIIATLGTYPMRPN